MITPLSTETRELFAEAITNLAPRERPRILKWSADNLTMPGGRAYDHAAYPHVGAPGGPFDAFDDPQTREIDLQWATRCGKSATGQAATCYTAATSNAPQMFATATKDLARDVVTTKLYPMIESCPALASRLRADGRRPFQRIDLGTQRINVAWAGSPSTLADRPCKVGHASEISKWPQPARPGQSSASHEADPLDLFEERFKEFPLRKVIKEGTPTIHKKCRIEAALLASTHCRYWVPCPHCGRYQLLRIGDGGPGGIRYARRDDKRPDPALAARTACYVCLHCEAQILDEHRAGMMRRGVWCPEGCTVDDSAAAALFEGLFQPGIVLHEALHERYQWRGWKHAAWIRGNPPREDTIAGYQLSSLYALTLGWGDIAAKWVRAQTNKRWLQNFINSWLAETFKVERVEEDWEKVAVRLIVRDRLPFVVPKGFSLITAGVDKQLDHYKWLAKAWAPGRVSSIIGYGVHELLDDIERDALDKLWPHEDGGPSLLIALSLIDGGFRPVEEGGLNLYERAKTRSLRGRKTYVCKGSSKPLGTPYRLTRLKERSSAPGAEIVHMDTYHSQDWIEDQLHKLLPSDPGGTALYDADPFEHRDLLEQLLNDAPTDDLDRNNNPTRTWNRIDADVPNDFRDCSRMADTAMFVFLRGGPISPRQTTPPAASPAQPQRFLTPHGQPFLATERDP